MSQFCVKQVVFNLSNTVIRDDEALMRSNTEMCDEEWYFLWFELSPSSIVMYWEFEALFLFLIHIWVGYSGVQPNLIFGIGISCPFSNIFLCVFLKTNSINHKFFVDSKSLFLVGDEIGHFIYEDYNISIKMICLDHRSGDF